MAGEKSEKQRPANEKDAKKQDNSATNESTSSSATSSVLDTLSIVTDNLETYQGRDTVITLAHYIALILADFCTFYGYKKRVSERFVNMFVQLSNCRVMLRLFDDFGAIRELYRFQKEQQVKKTVHSYVKFLTIVNLLFWVLYNPCEHLGWLAELKIIKADDQLWYFYTNVAWAGGLFTSVILNLRLVWLYQNQLEKKAKREDDPNYDSSEVISHSDMRNALLIALRDFIDWCIAIHFMPEGFLWSAQLYHYQVGLLGTISSLCRVHTYVINKQ